MKAAVKASKFQLLGVITAIAGAAITLVSNWAEQQRTDEKLSEMVDEALKSRGL